MLDNCDSIVSLIKYRINKIPEFFQFFPPGRIGLRIFTPNAYGTNMVLPWRLGLANLISEALHVALGVRPFVEQQVENRHPMLKLAV